MPIPNPHAGSSAVGSVQDRVGRSVRSSTRSAAVDYDYDRRERAAIRAFGQRARKSCRVMTAPSRFKRDVAPVHAAARRAAPARKEAARPPALSSRQGPARPRTSPSEGEKFNPIRSLPKPSAAVRVVRGRVPRGASILIIKEPWISLILQGRKSLEIRGRAMTSKDGERIYLAQSGGGGAVLGSAVFETCMGPLTASQWTESRVQHCVDGAKRPYGRHTFAWLLSTPERFDKPVKYTHKAGVVVWAIME